MYSQPVAKRLLDLCPGSVLVGGTARNLCLGLSNAKSDYDLLVAGSQLDLQMYLAKYLPDAQVLKTVGNTARIKQHIAHVDVLVFDLTVVQVSLAQDLRGRDLTINGLFMSQTSSAMSIQDLVGGVSDCCLRRIETYEDPLQVWATDPCRVIRAIRFRSQLSEQTNCHWQFGPKVADALYNKTADVANLLSYCNPSRLRNEVHWLLKARPASLLFRDLTYLPPELAEKILSLAGGKLTLEG
jgi:tRNA nucleotidyltransferase/poly(A) polymerase